MAQKNINITFSMNVQLFNTFTFLPCYQTWFSHNSGPAVITEDNRLYFSAFAVLISYWTKSERKAAWECKVKSLVFDKTVHLNKQVNIPACPLKE